MMKAAVVQGAFQFAIEERPIPEPQSGEVLVRIMAVGICGSDIHGMTEDGGVRRRPGLIMGHEAAGVIERLGEGVEGWRPGDRVALDPQWSCGQCEPCRHGWLNLCENGFIFGSSKLKFTHGAMCEYLAVPQKQLNLLPDQVTFAEGASLDYVGNAMHAVNESQSRFGDTFVVIGTGAIGLVAIQIARLRGAGKIIAVGTSPHKLAMAKKFGADRVIHSREENALEVIMEETDGKGAEVVIEAVGVSDTYALAVQAAKRRGKVMALGFASNEITIPVQPLLFREVSLIGITGYVFEAAPVLKMIANGKIDVKSITTELPLEEVQKAFEMIVGKKNEVIKVALIP
ncbi:alcohol dehydrogenase catalytic domain-containing protein [Cohnella herbarum]|uniref:Alcohol dehydrogenase catalytic domain-containing protein n=2 Tax=Cohnella herbarum TaxID=2728023 RepID=A0A7Z2VFA0_9BACL|nr:alcohol dehydrogenase catalytic domain-containing protein [Cohnella herbarum]